MKRTVLMLVLSTSLFAAGCKEKKEPASPADTPVELTAPADTAGSNPRFENLRDARNPTVHPGSSKSLPSAPVQESQQ